MSRGPRRPRTLEPGPRSEFLDAMQEAADILTGKLAPARVHTPETIAAIRDGRTPSGTAE